VVPPVCNMVYANIVCDRGVLDSLKQQDMPTNLREPRLLDIGDASHWTSLSQDIASDIIPRYTGIIMRESTRLHVSQVIVNLMEVELG
jgi:hypothetical protein